MRGLLCLALLACSLTPSVSASDFSHHAAQRDPYAAAPPPNVFDDPYGDEYGARGPGPARATRRRPRGPGAGVGLGIGGMSTSLAKGNKKYGVICLGGGSVVTLLGVTLMFERNLMRLGNVLQVAGLALLMGPPRLVRYLLQRSKLRGTAVFALGFFLMLQGRSFWGLLLEVFGVINLFGNMFPMVWAMLQRMPVVRELFKAPKRDRRRPAARYDDYGGRDDRFRDAFGSTEGDPYAPGRRDAYGMDDYGGGRRY